jgi:hypothetical protein
MSGRKILSPFKHSGGSSRHSLGDVTAGHFLGIKEFSKWQKRKRRTARIVNGYMCLGIGLEHTAKTLKVTRGRVRYLADSLGIDHQ